MDHGGAPEKVHKVSSLAWIGVGKCSIFASGISTFCFNANSEVTFGIMHLTNA